MSVRHVYRFGITSLAGVAVQVTLLWGLIHVVSLPYLTATALAVLAAILHNFVWHWRWTWADRNHAPAGWLDAFWKFALGNGVVSLGSNLILMPLLVDIGGLSPVPANLAAIASGGLLNFWLADRVAFRVTPPRRAGGFVVMMKACRHPNSCAP